VLLYWDNWYRSERKSVSQKLHKHGRPTLTMGQQLLSTGSLNIGRLSPSTDGMFPETSPEHYPMIPGFPPWFYFIRNCYNVLPLFLWFPLSPWFICFLVSRVTSSLISPGCFGFPGSSNPMISLVLLINGKGITRTEELPMSVLLTGTL